MFLWQIRKYEQETRNKRKQNICVVINYISHAKSAESAEFYFPLLFTLTLEMSQFHYDKRAQRQGGLNQK